jgi:hypothetical protein
MDHPPAEFGHRRPPPVQPAAPVKRSRHVALLVMGTVALGGGAYALMPSEHCDPDPAGITTAPGSAGNCSPRSSSSSWGSGHGYWGGRSASGLGLFGDGGSSGGSASDGGAGQVSRGGFGSFARAFSMHFSGGG